jgi:hypothetical protein
MAVEQTPDSVRRLEYLLLTREIEEFLFASLGCSFFLA